MSGVTGNNKIQSRKDFREILKYAKTIIKDFPGFVSVEPTGSYNSDKKKTTFGDMDLITHIDGGIYDNDKKKIKSALAKYFKQMPDSIIAPFVSAKYMGRKYYNSGEIITISLQVPNPSIQACQVDFMIAMDETETKFKKDFLDMPAAKQGIVLGLVKTALIEQTPNAVFKRLGIRNADTNKIDKKVQEYEFNLSSTEIQLRLVTYVEPGSFKQKNREIVWRSRDWDKLQVILKDFDLGLSFDKLIAQAKKVLKKTRSTRRMAGVFKSMISIKSGEVGKQKGIDKQKALDKVAKLFGENTMGNMKFADYINEKMNVNEKEETHGIFSGRFQPVTLAHARIIKRITKENTKATIFLVKGKKTSEDKEKNPFDAEIQKKMLEAVAPSNVDIQIINSGFFVDNLNEMPENKFVAYAGSDRLKAYEKFTKYMDEGKTLEIKEIKRTDDDISATKVRNALKEGDEKEFKKLTPKEIHNMFDELREILG